MKEHINQCKGVLHLCVFTVIERETDNICLEGSIHCWFWSFLGLFDKKEKYRISPPLSVNSIYSR